MRILLADDDDNKAAQVTTFLESRWSNVSVSRARSLQSALSVMLGEQFDLVLLDMTMPTFDISVNDNGGRPQPFAGKEVLRQLARHNVAARVVVLTQFPRFGQGAESRTLAQLDDELRHRFSAVYRGSIYYEAASATWRDELRDVVDELLGGVS